jgi:hyperosmotically inducible periplasmic protein
MKKPFLLPILVTGLVLTGCNKTTKSETAAADTRAPDYSTTAAASSTPANANPATAADTNRLSTDLSNAAHSASSALSDAGNQVANTARMTEWKLNASDIQADLDNNRAIVRTKDNVGQPTGTMDRKTLKTSVEGRLSADSDISALKLDVDAKKTGEVELGGKAQSADQVGKAIALALDTEGVTKVTSKIKLDKDAKTNR